MQSRKDVTIGIPVYNEEKNIQRLLKSLAIQKNITINKTIIVNDGSTDNTIKRISEIESSIKNKLNLYVINLEKNMGKANALNLIFKEANSEFLVLLDSDVVLPKSNIIDELIRCFQIDEDVGLVSGWYKIEPLKSSNKIAHAYRFSSILLEKLGKVKPLYSATGAIMALHVSVYKRISLPRNVIRDDAYIYLYTIKHGKKYIFCPHVKVIIPLYEKMKIKTFLYKQFRNNMIPSIFLKDFGHLAIDEFKINLLILLKLFFETYVNNPLDGTIWFTLKLVSIFFNKFASKESLRPYWRNYEK